MSTITRTQEAINKLSEHRHDGESLESIHTCLRRAAGIAGFVGDIACASQGPSAYHEINFENLEHTTKALELELQDAIIILEDYWHQQRVIEGDKEGGCG